MIDVGTVFPFAKDRLFVRLIVSPPVALVGTVIITGDQLAGVVVVAGTTLVARAAHVAVEPVTARPQL
jgi:hypothetical protein